MTILDSQVVVGVDVAKDEIVVYRCDEESTLIVANERSALKRWLKLLPDNCALALEATNTYHLDTTEIAHEWTCPFKIGHQLPVKLMPLPSA